MNDGNRVNIHVNIEVSGKALEAIVANAKAAVGRNEKGHYQVDTADKVGEIISRFLATTDFEAFASDPANY